MNLKLGKKAAVVDPRTIKMATLFKELPPPPAEYDFDLAHPIFKIPLPMFANDKYGDCVIAGRAHQTLRFEAVEQATLLSITDAEVVKQYFKESGGRDSGLVMLDSLKLWRKKGWKVGKKTYKIHAFGSVDWKKKQNVMMSLFYLSSCYTGVALPESGKEEFASGKPWTEMKSENNTWGGHCMIMTGYNSEFVKFITWSKYQLASWEWFTKRLDECYSLVDERDRWLGKQSPIDHEQLEDMLRIIAVEDEARKWW